MLQEERFEHIYELLRERGSVTVPYLKKRLFVSEATLRRDLAEMERQGLLTRVWGGAMLETTEKDLPSFARRKDHPEEKKRIAALARRYLHHSLSIFLDSSTSCLALLPQLAALQDLTVVTSSTQMAALLTEQTGAAVHLLGGQLFEGHIMTGHRAVESARAYHTDLMFFSCSGLNADGAWSIEPRVVEVNREMMKHADHRILLCDSSKFEKTALWRLAELTELDAVLSDATPEDEHVRRALGERLVVGRTEGKR